MMAKKLKKTRKELIEEFKKNDNFFINEIVSLVKTYTQIRLRLIKQIQEAYKEEL